MMAKRDSNDFLGQISTLWSLVIDAHQGPDDAMAEARQLLLARYGGAAQRYLLGAVRDEDAATELYHEFAKRFLSGDFHRADPEKGRFRNFLKSSLFYLVVKFKKKRRKEVPLVVDPVDRSPSPDNSEEDFVQNWRAELLARAWERLAIIQEQTGQPYHTVLRFRADNPNLTAAAMAERLAAVLGRPITVAAARQVLHRARQKFAAELLDEVVQSLRSPAFEQVEEELIDLDLLRYCKAALHRR
jgi:RNA polymerase sigma-70 factor (ECF subfamily)